MSQTKITLFITLSFLFILTPAHAQQLPTVQNLDLPQGYETWKPADSGTLTIRKDLVIEKQIYANESDNRVQLIKIGKINSEIVHVLYFEGGKENSDASARQLIVVTLYLLTRTGYTKFDDKNGIPSELETERAGQIWDKFMRDQYNINDEEMAKLEKFLEL